jgi:sugar lactone lactonase YvrE
MAFVVGGVVLTTWSGNQRNAVYGPSAITRDAGGRVWLLAARRLFVLEADGRLALEAPLAELGMDESVNALAALPQGGAIAGSHDLGLIYVLDTGGRVTRTVTPATPLTHGLALYVDGPRWLVAHVGFHRLLALDANGQVLHEAGAADGRPGEFHFPNNLAKGSDGLLYVADTNHHEIEVRTAELGRAREPIAVPWLGAARWPVAVAPMPSGQLMVTVLADDMRHGVVALLHADGRLDRQLELQPRAEPLELLVREDDVLVCDQHDGRYQVRRFGHDGDFAGEFGDAAFLAAMREAAQRHRGYARLRTGGRALTLLAALALLLVYRQSRQLQTEEREQQLEMPATEPPNWRAELPLNLALAGPLLAVAVALLAATRIRMEPAIAIAVYLGLFLALLLALRLGFANAQSARLAPLIQAQSRRWALKRLAGLSWWGQREPVVGCARAMLGSRGVLVLVSPVRLVVLPALGSSPLETIALRSIVGSEPGPVPYTARMLGGRHARGLRLRLLEPQARTLDLAFVFTVEHDAVVEALRVARQRGPAIAPTATGAPRRAVLPALTAPRRSSQSNLLLSMLLPGLGHLSQQRHDEGTLILRLFGAYAVAVGLEWFVHLRRIADVGETTLMTSTALLAVAWVAVLADVWRHERALRRHDAAGSPI